MCIRDRLNRLCPHLLDRINQTGELRDADRDSLIGYIRAIFEGDGCLLYTSISYTMP